MFTFNLEDIKKSVGEALAHNNSVDAAMRLAYAQGVRAVAGDLYSRHTGPLLKPYMFANEEVKRIEASIVEAHAARSQGIAKIVEMKQETK